MEDVTTFEAILADRILDYLGDHIVGYPVIGDVTKVMNIIRESMIEYGFYKKA